MDTLRPETWDDYIGQTRLKNELEIRIDSALVENRSLDPVLLVGPPGAGKTALADIIAYKLDEGCEILTMPVKIQVLIQLIQEYSGVILFDEIHRCSAKEQETLLPLLEFGYLQTTNGVRVYAEDVTIIGATTEPDKLIEPLVDRFPIRPEWERYTDAEMALITLGMASKAGVPMATEHAEAFGVAASGTPRRARQFVIGFRDLLNSQGHPPSVEQVLHLCRTFADGLTSKHVRYVETLYALGGTRGMNVISSLMRESTQTIQELERLLVEKGYVTFGPTGRMLTTKGMARAREERGEGSGRRRGREKVRG